MSVQTFSNRIFSLMSSTIYYRHLLFLTLISGCNPIDDNFSPIPTEGPQISNTLQTAYSPDKSKYCTLVEYGSDSANAVTQVLVHMPQSTAGAYAVTGLGKRIRVYWQDNSTVIIETLKSYKPKQKWPQVQSFNTIIRIIYIER